MPRGTFDLSNCLWITKVLSLKFSENEQYLVLRNTSRSYKDFPENSPVSKLLLYLCKTGLLTWQHPWPPLQFTLAYLSWNLAGNQLVSTLSPHTVTDLRFCFKCHLGTQSQRRRSQGWTLWPSQMVKLLRGSAKEGQLRGLPPGKKQRTLLQEGRTTESCRNKIIQGLKHLQLKATREWEE